MKKEKLILTVTLNPAVDKFLYVNGFKVNTDHRAECVSNTAGGKGLNVSRAVKALGGKTLATGILGGTSGMFIKHKLDTEKLPHDFYFCTEETRTNVTVVDTKNWKFTRVLEPGLKIDNTGITGFRKKFVHLLPRAGCVVFTGKLLPGITEKYYAGLIKLANRYGVLTILDAGGKTLRDCISAKPYMIKPNLSELESFVGKTIRTPEHLRRVCEGIHRKGVKLVVVSMAEKGLLVYNGKKFITAKPPVIKAQRTNVGLGDSLVAGFAYALTHDMSFMIAVRFATAVSAASVISSTPGLCNPRDVVKMYKKIVIV
ncbi:MAG: 1-phosphofructokinase family hexose kinase [Elusimicrobiota bacterium]